MIDEQNPESCHDESSNKLHGRTASPKPTNSSKTAEEQPKSKENQHYSQYIMRPLKAFGRGTVKTVNWLNAKAGFVTAIATVLIAVLTGFYVHYSRAQWQVMNGQLTQIKAGNEIQGSELELSQRPWVDAQISLEGPLRFDENGATVPLRFGLRNTGHSPAFAANIEVRPVLPFIDNDPSQYVAQVCKEATRDTMSVIGLGIALFPNAAPFEERIGVEIGKNNIEEQIKQLRKRGAHFGRTLVGPSIVACIGYRPPFNVPTVYHTSYIIDIMRLNANNVPISTFPIGKIVDISRLRLQLHPLNGISAN